MPAHSSNSAAMDDAAKNSPPPRRPWRDGLAATRSLRSGARTASPRHALRSEDSASRLTMKPKTHTVARPSGSGLDAHLLFLACVPQPIVLDRCRSSGRLPWLDALI